MKSLLVKLEVLFIGLLILGNAKAWGADWKIYGYSPTGTSVYYDEQSIVRSENIVRVWTKAIYSGKDISSVIEKYGP